MTPPTTSITTLWETLEVVARGHRIAIAARLNTARCEKRQRLEDEIRVMEATHSRTGSLAVKRQLTALRKQLRSLDGDRAEYALFRTNQKFYAGGDKAGRLLAHCLHMQTASRRVAELRLLGGTLTSH
ncbi:hypothetical protein NDU88_005010 [Pleurodeles waltl]|uniref:Uncharacterized protein n=1 Tax=Pleurodeles waltl TaxID=8319 RepID=A0AAV7LJT3_PLEWA|nr:hypothetical protein NDU88_005010 [Pleurodeles waltl]